MRSTVGTENQRTYTTRTSGALAGILKDEYPEVLDVTRLMRREVFVTAGDKGTPIFKNSKNGAFNTH